MTAVLLACAPLLMIGMAIMARKMQASARGSSDDFSLANQISSEVLSGFRTVASFSREPYERDRYARALVGATNEGVKRAYYNGIGMGSTFFFMFFTYALGIFSSSFHFLFYVLLIIITDILYFTLIFT